MSKESVEQPRKILGLSKKLKDAVTPVTDEPAEAALPIDEVPSFAETQKAGDVIVRNFTSGNPAAADAIAEQQRHDRAADIAEASKNRSQAVPQRVATRSRSFKQLCAEGIVTVGAGQPRLRVEPSPGAPEGGK